MSARDFPSGTPRGRTFIFPSVMGHRLGECSVKRSFQFHISTMTE
jgi:hypothetical protein